MPLDLASLATLLTARHQHSGRVDLNDIAEVIGDRAASYAEVEELIAMLEAAGLDVGGTPTVREMALLREVLEAARALQREHGRRPTVSEIAHRSEQPDFVVRRALENGQMMASALGAAEDKPEPPP